MKIEDILFIVLLTFGVISLIFRCIIRKNVIKPSKISRIFYQDDESFINFWRKTQEKGILKYIIKNIIFKTVMTSILGIVSILYKPQGMTMFFYLSMGIVLGLLSFISWSDNQNKYNQLKEKGNMEIDNINIGNKKN